MAFGFMCALARSHTRRGPKTCVRETARRAISHTETRTHIYFDSGNIIGFKCAVVREPRITLSRTLEPESRTYGREIARRQAPATCGWSRRRRCMVAATESRLC